MYTDIEKRGTFLSSLNLRGFTTLKNDTNINGPLPISGLNGLETLSSSGTGKTKLKKFY